MNSQTQKTEPDPDSIKMFVGQVPRSMDENDLRQMFSEFGEIYQLNVLRDKLTGHSKGCCFITFYTRKGALDAQNALHNIKTMPGMHHPVQMKPADSEKRNGTHFEERKLFVGMLAKKCSEAEVRMMFSPFGGIEDCTVLRDQSGNSKGCAFVTYSSRQCAQTAITKMHHSQTMEGCSMPVVAKFADTQKEKEQKKFQVVNNNMGLSIAGLASLNSLNPNYLSLLQQAAASGNIGAMSSLGNLGASHSLSMQQLIACASMPSVSNTLGGNSMLSPGLTCSNVNLTMSTPPLPGVSHPQSRTSSHLAGVGLQTLGNPLAGISSPPVSNSLASFNGPASLPCSNSGINTMAANSPLSSFGSINGNGLCPSTIPASPTGMDALSQAYSGIQQYAASFPNAFTSASAVSQIQAMNSPAGKQTEGPEGGNLFIYHLPQEFQDSDIMQTFMPFGNIVSAKVFIDKQTNLSKCFGFVSYDNALSAQAAIQAMNGFQIGMKRLKVQLKRPKSESKPY